MDGFHDDMIPLSLRVKTPLVIDSSNRLETFEKYSILFKAKEDDNFNHRNTLSILRIKI
jgi:hypothetical protein